MKHGITVGVDNVGHDVKFFGATASKYWLWDESADGVVQLGTLTVGADTDGYDVKFFGATTAKYFLWDEDADKLIVVGTSDLGTSCEADAYTVAGGAGADYSSADATSFTFVKGICTAISA
jgi:hypothetical protein